MPTAQVLQCVVKEPSDEATDSIIGKTDNAATIKHAQKNGIRRFTQLSNIRVVFGTV